MRERNRNIDISGLKVSFLWKGTLSLDNDRRPVNRQDGEYSFMIYGPEDENGFDEMLASVVMTFPVMDGETEQTRAENARPSKGMSAMRTVFINRLDVLIPDDKAVEISGLAMGIIEDFAVVKNSYRMIYADANRVNTDFLMINGFRPVDGWSVYGKDLKADCVLAAGPETDDAETAPGPDDG